MLIFSAPALASGQQHCFLTFPAAIKLDISPLHYTAFQPVLPNVWSRIHLSQWMISHCLDCTLDLAVSFHLIAKAHFIFDKLVRTYTSGFCGTTVTIMEKLSLKKNNSISNSNNYIWAIRGMYSICLKVSFIHGVLLSKAERRCLRGTDLEELIPQPFILFTAESWCHVRQRSDTVGCSGALHVAQKQEWKLVGASGKEAALGDNTVVISITRNRDLQPFFSHALTTLLLTGSSNLEKLCFLFSVSVFFLLHHFSLLSVSLQCFTFWMCWI